MLDFDAIQRRAEQADRAIVAVAANPNKFQMCVPPQPDDTDMLVCTLTREDIPALLARARQADRMEAAIRAVVRSSNPLAALAELHDFAERELMK